MRIFHAVLVVMVLAPAVAVAGVPALVAPGHVLQMQVGGEAPPVSSQITFTKDDDERQIIADLPEGEQIVVPVLISDDGGIKFQFAKVADDRILAIHFIGSTDGEESWSGAFTGMIDGEIDEHMSGTFKLSPK